MKTTYKPEYNDLLLSGQTSTAIAKKLDVAIMTVCNWRKTLRAGKVPKAYNIDKGLIDRLLAEKVPAEEIARRAGCSTNTVYSRDRINKNRPVTRHWELNVNAFECPGDREMIPPGERLERAMKEKMADWSPTHRAAFLGSVEGQRWAAEIGC